MRLYRTSNNAPVSLGKELGRGGEGAVFPVPGVD
jgi:DNA-binding helix-hairpin-helix protein with protein kinase domain